jgi:hypothetical protein
VVSPEVRSVTERAHTRGGRPRVDPRAAWGEVRRSPAALYSTLSVAVLLGYLLVRKPLEPGFTDHWGYMIVQIAGTLVLMLVLTVWSAPQGGFSWYTYLVVAVNTWADTLGTAGPSMTATRATTRSRISSPASP